MTWTPFWLTVSGRCCVDVSPDGGDFGGCLVADPGVWSVVVDADVAGDVSAGLVDCLPFGSPGDAFLELPEPGLDERLGLAVAVAAPAVGDATRGQVFAEAA